MIDERIFFGKKRRVNKNELDVKKGLKWNMKMSKKEQICFCGQDLSIFFKLINRFISTIVSVNNMHMTK